ncbi:hypothetical protein [Halobacillus alkaliphilus]|uniref:hypothetical protein n=1 Tax=Halobacillus alkaliphilus TaxID=396056 RepID=UPI001FE02C7F|nr:hypothetical protein [Halobacillus alkaliphilus]
MLNNGETIVVIQSLLGHEKLNILLIDRLTSSFYNKNRFYKQLDDVRRFVRYDLIYLKAEIKLHEEG